MFTLYIYDALSEIVINILLPQTFQRNWGIFFSGTCAIAAISIMNVFFNVNVK